MADPAIDPYNPDDTGTPQAGSVPAPDATRADDGSIDEPADLEAQVEGLLKDVTDAVEDIQKKLNPDPPPDYTDQDAIDDELTAFADDAPDGEMFSNAEDIAEDLVEDEPIEDEPIDSEPEPEPGPEPVTEDDNEPIAVEAPAPEPDPAPEADTEAEAADETETPFDSTPEADALSAVQAALKEAVGTDDDSSPAEASATDHADHPSATGRAPSDQQLLKDEVETARTPEGDTEPARDYTDGDSLEEELAALSEETPTDPPVPETPAAPQSPVDTPESDLEDPEPEAEPVAETDPDTPPDYTDAAALDDELAALAAEALDEDASIESPHEADGTTDPSPVPEPEPAAAETPSPEPQPAAEEITQEPTNEPAPAPEPVPASPDSASRWGWLPPKPEWPEVYTRWRPLVIAWRHIAWIVPPLAVYLWSTAWAWLAPRAKDTAIKAEPHVRLAVAKIAAPLSRRDERTRSIIGWFAVYTLFVSACLWVYILVGRSPVAPEPSTPATNLARETATADANN